MSTQFARATNGAVQSSRLTVNKAAALCYLAGFVTGILFLVSGPYNERSIVRFHAFQSILFHAVWNALLALGVTLAIFAPSFLAELARWSVVLVWATGFVLRIYLMWKAYERQYVALPLIGRIAERHAMR